MWFRVLKPHVYDVAIGFVSNLVASEFGKTHELDISLLRVAGPHSIRAVRPQAPIITLAEFGNCIHHFCKGKAAENCK